MNEGFAIDLSMCPETTCMFWVLKQFVFFIKKINKCTHILICFSYPASIDGLQNQSNQNILKLGVLLCLKRKLC